MLKDGPLFFWSGTSGWGGGGMVTLYNKSKNSWYFLEKNMGIIVASFNVTCKHFVLLQNFLYQVFSENCISNGNRTVWSPIRSVIIGVINKIGWLRSGSPICLITTMITGWIGRHEVLLPINHNFNKICDTIGYFLNQNTRNSKFCFASSEKKSHLCARVMARTVQLLRHDAHCPIKADTHEGFCSQSMLQAHFARVSTHEGAFCPGSLLPNI